MFQLPTVVAFGSLITGLLACLAFSLSLGSRTEKELAWWGLAYTCIAFGLALFATAEGKSSWAANGGNAFILWGVGFSWAGLRALTGRSTRWEVMLAGGFLWLMACTVPAFLEDVVLRLVLRSVLGAVYALLMVMELASFRGEKSVTHWLATALAGLHCIFSGVFAISAALFSVGDAVAIYDLPIVRLIALEGIVYGLLMGFTLVAHSKERVAARHRVAAATDPLTGLLNRRAFTEEASKALDDASGTALLAFDLDHFKQVNDRFGHPAGDQALQVFARVAAGSIRSGDIISRLGGEEFAAVLRNADPDTALSVANRIRVAFAREASAICDGAASVSVGIAMVRDGADLYALLSEADAALYRAKALGRNRAVSLSCAA
ncbi:GGDEF domain-containing protein [Limobrevibacterium gyesilva]|uniref:diguanylate cyclase n=1 Tax=Limobrevibacterium gyesilva TaxID=2991712 RepID=A0AA41YZ31_9PROT|nr:GGDEF domain-containing protein [Limobrevibacterium gyesilva]MCW3477882.1 GGDEF domain-containing protein [Limobrevibacterium gyesilva]